jgi:hypothetical protein
VSLCGKITSLMLSCLSCDQNTHIALAFEVPGGWNQEKFAMIVTVLQVYQQVKYSH